MNNIPPALVEADTVNQRIALIGVNSNVGSIPFGGALYLPAVEQDVNDGSNRLIVFKSVDDGATWAPLDRANSPIVHEGSYDVYAYYPHFPQTPGSTIYMAYSVPFPVTGFGRARLIQFDLNTETMGAPSANTPRNLIVNGLAVLSNGDQVIVGNDTAANAESIYAIVYSAGVWASAVTVRTTAAFATVSSPALALDTSDRLLISWAEDTPNSCKVAVFVAGAVSTTTTVTNRFISTSPGIYIPSLDEIWFPAQFDPVSGNSVGLFKGTPSSAPVWTIENPGGVFPNLYARFCPVIAIKDETDIFLAWMAVIDDPTNELQVQYLEKVNLGAWGSTQVLWDTITQPLTPPSPFPHDAELQFQIGYFGTTLSMTVALFQDFPIIGGFCGTIYYLSKDFTPIISISITCPIGDTATVGVPFDSGVPTVMGGQEPFHFSIVGGSLPPGFTLNADTGEITGTTYVTGTFNYTLEVTDSSSPPQSAVVDAPCPIGVGGGASTLPCANITPQPSTDVQFKLIKVLATMGPVKRLPVRGSVQ